MLSNYKKKPQGSTKFFISNSPELNRRPGCAHIAFKKIWLDDTAISICLLCSAKTVFASNRGSCRSTLSTCNSAVVQFPSLIAQATLYREHFFGSEGLLLSLAWIQPRTSRQSHVKWTGTLFQPLEWSQMCCGVSWHNHGSADVQEPALWPPWPAQGLAWAACGAVTQLFHQPSLFRIRGSITQATWESPFPSEVPC